MSAGVSVRVPATSSNLGAGFDCVGIAVDRWLEASAEITLPAAAAAGPPLKIERAGTLTSLDLPPQRDLLYAGFAAACRAASRDLPGGLVLRASSEIPIGRGLGSSAAAIVAGALLADRLLGLGLDDHAIIGVGSQVEGHPDNVAPAVLGGATLAARGPAGLAVAPIPVHPSLALIFAVPDFAVATTAARAVLPDVLPHRTAVTAASRAAALVAGLASGRGDLLVAALDDVLHVPYRRRLVRGYEAVTGAARDAGAFGATLSGSGSGIVAIGLAERARAVERAMAAAWRALDVAALTFAATRSVGGYRVSPRAPELSPSRST